MQLKDIKKVLSFGDKKLVLSLIDLVNCTEQEKEIIKLNYLEKITEDEIAFRMNVSKGYVQKHKRKCIKKMSECWENNYQVKRILKR